MNLNSKNLLWGVGAFLAILVALWGMWELTTAPATSLAPAKPVDLKITASDHTMGPDTAKVTLVEYSDLQCPACQSYNPVVKELLNKHPKDLRLVYRHFPLDMHEHALEAAYAAEAAAKQGKFFEYHDLLFDNQQDWEKAKNVTSLFMKYARELKLNEKQFTADMKSKDVQAKVEADKMSGTQLKINSTPTFYINGAMIKNPNSLEAFDALIQAKIQ